MTAHRLAVFFRRPGEVCLTRTDGHSWGPVTIEYGGSTDPLDAVGETFGRRDAESILRVGGPIEIDDRRWIPVLVDRSGRTELDRVDDSHEWVSPVEIRRRDTIPGCWRLYDGVRPTPEAIRTDTTHGSATLSIWGLEYLRDQAGYLATCSDLDDDCRPSTTAGEWDACCRAATELLEARPSMMALSNRIHRALATAAEDDRIESNPAECVERAATDGINRATAADRAAGSIAAEIITAGAIAAEGADTPTVLTLSTSGTVLATIERAEPSVYVAESRPKREGTDLTERLAERGFDVTLHSDAAIASVLDTEPIDALLVGADTVLSDGRILNKVGTRGAAIAAHTEDVPVYVVAAADKISPWSTADTEFGSPEELYADPIPERLTVTNPTFDLTPAVYVDRILTDRGAFEPSEIEAIAEEHRTLRQYTSDENGGCSDLPVT